MQLEYFQLIDRQSSTSTSTRRPFRSSAGSQHKHLRGAFPGLSNHARVFADRIDGADSGWLLLALMKDAWPVVSGSGSQMRGSVSPRHLAD